MGKGDIKTKRGKITNHSYGVRRLSKESLKKQEKEMEKKKAS